MLPLTMLVVLIIVGCLVGGVLMFIYALTQRAKEAEPKVCQRCRTANPSHARFCAQCGRALA